MYIEKFYANGYKNLKEAEFYPHEKINILCGDNAQGKTNLIEAIWICSGAKSFRNTKDKRMIGDDSQKMNIEITFKDSFRRQEIKYSAYKENLRDKEITLNGVKVRSIYKLFGNLKCVIFTPEDLELSKGSPDKRRQFLDLSISQLKGSYKSVAEKYENLLEQRNVLIKNINLSKSNKDELEVWDEQLSQMGAYISYLRYNYIKKLNIFAKKMYGEISQGKETFEIEYKSTVFSILEGKKDFAGEMAEEYRKALKENLECDLKAGFTLKGIHRDDICIKINGKNVREYASQGQHRSAALVMKLSQAYILAQETGDFPCILLDDVLSELDESRQKFVISKIHKMQVFITCCNRNIPFDKNSHGKIFFIREGRITNEPKIS